MIDNPNDAFAQYEAQARLRAELAREVTPLNRAALFAVLQAAGVQHVTVHFDGAGDCGQIESIDATAPDETAVELPDGTIEIRTPLWDGSGVQTETMPVRDAIEKLTCDFLEEARDGWGIFMAERLFGPTITTSTGRVVPLRLIGEQHVREDLGFIASFADWVRRIRCEPWMGRAQPVHRDVDPFAATA